jgi:hypothetical protein
MLTNGYDYIFALSWDAVNSMLASNLQDKDIEIIATEQDSDLGLTITLDLKLAPWQIVAGGGNTLVHLCLPIREGAMQFEGAVSKSYDLSGVSAIVQVALGWLGAGDQQQESGDGDSNNLVFRPESTDPSSPGGVAFVDIVDPHNVLDTVGKGALRDQIPAALIANRDKLQYIFANINPTPPAVSSWLNPKRWQYYNVYAGSGPSALAFLCQLSDKAFPPQATFDANNLAPDHNTLLLISQEAFFDNVILPSIRATFPSGSFSSSVNAEEEATIQNSGDFTVGNVQASHYTLTTNKEGNGLAIAASGGGPLKFIFGLADLPDASYSWGVASNNPLQYNSGVLSVQQDPNPTISHDQTIQWYDWVLMVVTGITTLSGLVDFITALVTGFYDDSQAMGIGALSGAIQSSIGGSVVNLANLVEWNKSGAQFTPAAAGLSTSLYIRGDYE